MIARLFSLVLTSALIASAAEVLTLQQAVQLATANNRSLRNAGIEIQKARTQALSQRTSLYPAFKLNLLASQLVTPVDFTLEKGLLGTYPGTGPIPASDVPIKTPLRPTAIFVGSITQPLSQIHRIRLGLKLLDLNRELATEQARGSRQDVVRSVKKLYYGIQQAQSSLSAAGEAVKLYRETESLVARYLAEQVVLKGDHLDAQVRLARAEQSQLTFEDQIASGKEQLNHLMGRDVLTAFEVTGALEAAEFESDVEAARGRALAQRPEVRQARLKLDQAEQDRRLKRSEYIPDISASFNSVEVVGFNTFIPLHFNSVGVNISWEPFDWGRKKHDLVGKDQAIEQARNSAADAEGQVILDVNDSFRKLRESRVQLRVARLQQETAIENLRVVQEKFKQQASLTREVLSSQSSLEQANADYRQALIFFWTTKADFEHAVGDNP